MTNFKAEFYENAKGKKPAKEFILSLEPKMKAKMFGSSERMNCFILLIYLKIMEMS